MAHSAACRSSASQSTPTRRPNAETPYQLLSLPVSKKTADAVLYHLHIAIACCRPPPPSLHMHESLPRARTREGVKKSVLSVCGLSVSLSVSLSSEKF